MERFASRLEESIRSAKSVVGKLKGRARLHMKDSRTLDFIETSSVDLLVTSPPYLNAYDYHKYHRHRLHWIEGDVAMARDTEVGKHDTFSQPGATPEKYFEDMDSCFREWSRVLRPGGNAVVIVGDAIVSGQAVPVADRFTAMMGELNLELSHHVLRSVKQQKKSFGAGARANLEHVLVYKKT